MATTPNYIGGVPELKKACEVTVKVTASDIRLSAGMFSKAVIAFDAITDVAMKTDEQISKDVTLGRLIALGVFAFGAKKTSKRTTYNLVIAYHYGGLETSAVFSGDGVPEVNSEILKRRVSYLKKHPQPAPAEPIASAPLSDQPVDAAAEISKYKGLLDAGALTQEEYDAKKKHLLGL